MHSTRWAILAAALAVAAAGQDLKLDDIIKRSVDAQGGLDKIRAIQSMKVTGKMVLGGGSLEAPVVSYLKRPHCNRMEIRLQGQLIVDAYDGTTKWTINPMTGRTDAQKAEPDETLAAADDADMIEGPLADYKQKGSKVELLGTEDVDGASAYKMKVTFKSGSVRTVYVDATTFLIAKEVTKVARQGQEFDTETLPSNYKKVNGVTMPFSTTMKVNQQIGMQLEFEKVEMNVPVDDALFAFPAYPKTVDPPKPR